MKALRIGTRGSPLALWQARAVAERLERQGRTCALTIIRTSGDRLADAALSDAGGKRLFVKEIEDALLGDEIDLAVHSAKDLPAELPDGLLVAGVLPREDPRDALVLPAGAPGDDTFNGALARLGEAPRIGTNSVRRVTQLQRLLPGASFQPVRGNLDTRLRKLDEGQSDALVLAAAGLNRLGLAHRVTACLPIAACVPAPGQGVVAMEVRAEDGATHAAVARIDDEVTGAALRSERALVEALGGGCQLPLGAVALTREVRDGQRPELDLHAIVVSLDGRRTVRHRDRAPLAEAAALGRRVADELIRQGAAEILDEVRKRPKPI